jgi:hypothetical protein
MMLECIQECLSGINSSVTELTFFAKEKSSMKLPKQMIAVQRQINTLPTATAVAPALLGDLLGGVFDLGSLVCQFFSGQEREDCLRGYYMVAGPAKKTLGGIGDLLL